jgi:phosphoglycerate kinase
MIKSVRDIGDVRGKVIFVRVDFNVPITGDNLADDFRIKRPLETINLLRERGANLILSSHPDPEDSSARPLCEILETFFSVTFVEDYYPNTPDFKDLFAKTQVVFLENLRKHKEEKENDDNFAKHLASFADYYVNEAFAVTHREHASIIGVPKYIPAFSGLSLEKEMTNLSQAFNPPKPFLFILGGAKFETKIPLLKKFLNLADKVFVGGALANDLLKAKGVDVGHSLVSTTNIDIREFLSGKLILPVDVVAKNGDVTSVKEIDQVRDGDVIVDVGPKSISNLQKEVNDSKFVLWNGPLGNYELGFKQGTDDLAKCIAESPATTIVGGGDTVASISELKLNEKFTFVSTGGGAMLDFLANETLPGIEALNGK